MVANGRTPGPDEPPALITGGAGFIGTNLANRLLTSGRRVQVLDNLARPNVEHNLRWLQASHGERLQVIHGDVRDSETLRSAVLGVGEVFHFAAQVAVTTSVTNPLEDFEVNARGALNVLEALRALPEPPPLIFTSTNKVYGGLEDVSLALNGGRYEPEEAAIRAQGVSERRPLDFHSPYGCSKGAADQYVIDYARIYGLQTVVFRMSCIYGPHQWGVEDQGWVAHFLIRALAGEPITLYGDGRQVRDVLYIDDLLDAFLLARANASRLAGNAFNIGGGPERTTSLLELLDLIAELNGSPAQVSFSDAWRPGDQRYYVSDTHKFQDATGWSPRVGVHEGVSRLFAWLRENRVQPQPSIVRSGVAR